MINGNISPNKLLSLGQLIQGMGGSRIGHEVRGSGPPPAQRRKPDALPHRPQPTQMTRFSTLFLRDLCEDSVFFSSKPLLFESPGILPSSGGEVTLDSGWVGGKMNKARSNDKRLFTQPCNIFFW